ncbi:unnamed protein product [Schistosoma margrebowiei]|uniref:Uncharacterized protein n=1 Tax=Schistosoma margrebowiei TaxID=48269 RepID=A0A183MCB9_9TREM|nr:unnamed protein product [Schistosoma margrebowiei]
MGQNVANGKASPLRNTFDSTYGKEDVSLTSVKPFSQIQEENNKLWNIRDAICILADPQEPISIVLGNIHELLGGDQNEAYEHNKSQWRWLSCNIGLHATTMNSVPKLPRLLHRTTIKSPRLICVNFKNREHLSEVLRA